MSDNYLWWRDGVIYQVYPRSFQDTNSDGVGDLQGIINRLDYLESLGIDALWISPIYPSPMADFGYDVSDYRDIHPLFGDMATFERLLDAAHARGLRVVLDFVPNHTSDQHPWFIESRSSRNNPKRDWYIWRDPAPDGGPPNNWESFFGGPAWTYDAATGQYYLHLFLKEQPDLNWRNPDVVAAIHAHLRFWLDKGVDGFRIDVVTFIMKHPDFPDNPPATPEQRALDPLTKLQHKYDVSHPDVHRELKAMRRIFDSYDGDRVMIGETVDTDPRKLAQYYGDNLDELHLPFNFKLHWEAAWDPREMRDVIASYYAALPAGATPNFVIGSHDRKRPATRFGRENMRAAMMLLLTLWGAPTIYYGDEIGMLDVPVPREQWQDPWGVNNPGANVTRDTQRTPMQWDDTANAGFCAPGIDPWLPLAADYATVNVAAQERNPRSLLNIVRRLIALRRALPVLHGAGAFAFVDAVPADVLAYTRERDGVRVLVVLNFGGAAHTLDLSALGDTAQVLLSTHMDRPGPVLLRELDLRGREGLLLRLA